MNEEIILDLDRVRIIDVLTEIYSNIGEQLNIEFDISLEDFLKKAQIYLDSNRIAIPVFLDLPSKKIPDLKIEVDFRKKSVFARTRMKNKQAKLNYYLKAL